jgi:hypothetical protein
MPTDQGLRKLPFCKIAEGLRPEPLVPVVKEIQARAQRQGRSPHELVDELMADAGRLTAQQRAA